jgi:hypothetical protein
MAKDSEHPCIKCGMIDREENMQALRIATDEGASLVWVHADCLEQYRQINTELALLEFFALFEKRAAERRRGAR